MPNKTFGFIGGGRVSHLLLKSFQRQSALPQKVLVSDPDEKALKKVTGIDPQTIQAVSENRVAAAADVVFLAVHPPVLETVAQEIKNTLKQNAIIVSFIPTVRIKRLAQLLDGFDPICRMIPNAPSIIGKGYNPVCFSSALHEDDRAFLRGVFEQWGQSPEVDEEHLEAYAILTGMGPTYFWFQWLELQRLGVDFGLSQSEATQAVAAMLHGAVDTLFASGISFDQVLELIPSYPLKKNEEEIRRIFSERLKGLWRKLCESTN